MWGKLGKAKALDRRWLQSTICGVGELSDGGSNYKREIGFKAATVERANAQVKI